MKRFSNPLIRQNAAVWLAIGWLAVYAFVFYRLDLPNSSPPANRLDVWAELPDLLYYCVVSHPDLPPAGWRHFPQRLPFIAVGGWILCGAWGLGSLLLRGLGLHRSNPLGSDAICEERADSLPDSTALTRLERFLFAMGLGLTGLSLLTLSFGLLAQVIPGLLGRIPLGTCVTLPAVIELFLRGIQHLPRRECRDHTAAAQSADSVASQVRGSRVQWSHAIDVLLRGQIPYGVLCRLAAAIAMVLFVMAISLGSILPEVDFDVKEYHLQGPKEWYQAGAVSFLPHNVYTSFPFLTEMLSLLSMVLYGDWYWGALTGKFVLAAFGILTTLAVFAAGRRWFGSEAAWTAALIHISTPWTYRISIIAYAEGGLTFFLFATLSAALLAAKTGHTSFVLLAGLFAGSAMACKYPGLVSVTVPIGGWLLWAMWRSSRAKLSTNAAAVREGQCNAVGDRSPQYESQGIDPVVGRRCAGPTLRRAMVVYGLVYAVGVCLTVGPWLMKNFVETGNPVYPLLNNVFRGIDWTPTLEANWKRAHGPPHHHPAELAIKFFDVTFKADWLSPLLFSLAPLAFLLPGRRSLVTGLWLYVAYLFATWWGLTHRIDRFWIPLIPIVALLAGAGTWWSPQKLWRRAAGAFIALCVLFNLGFVTTPNCGLNTYLSELSEVRDAAETTSEGIAELNRRLPPNAKVLLVGEAQVFDARFPLIYNTVFDVSIFEQWCAAGLPDVPSAEQPLRPTDQIRKQFQQAGVTHVFVNWGEILRYRDSGYGYSDFVTPKTFEELQRLGLLHPTSIPLTGFQSTDAFKASELRDVRAWAPQLLIQTPQGEVFLESQLFVVQR